MIALIEVKSFQQAFLIFSKPKRATLEAPFGV
jgi:hypothetical protein